MKNKKIFKIWKKYLILFFAVTMGKSTPVLGAKSLPFHPECGTHLSEKHSFTSSAQWLKFHTSLIQEKYLRTWIAVSKTGIVAQGKQLQEVLQRSKESGVLAQDLVFHFEYVDGLDFPPISSYTQYHSAGLAWADANRNFLQTHYKGEWVAVTWNGVVTHGSEAPVFSDDQNKEYQNDGLYIGFVKPVNGLLLKKSPRHQHSEVSPPSSSDPQGSSSIHSRW